jgi:hypothetical protein
MNRTTEMDPENGSIQWNERERKKKGERGGHARINKVGGSMDEEEEKRGKKGRGERWQIKNQWIKERRNTSEGMAKISAPPAPKTPLDSQAGT